MIEDEAKTLRCCGPEGCGEARGEPKPEYGDWLRFCIGSKCMAWRWENEFQHHGCCGLADR